MQNASRNAAPPVAAPERASSGNGATWVGFLAAAFCLVGMTGLFATYAAPLPYQRETSRIEVLDRLAATPPGQRAALRDALGDSADAVLNGDGPLAPRIDAERASVRTRFGAQAQSVAERLRLLIMVMTIMAALFGAVLLGLQRRG